MHVFAEDFATTTIHMKQELQDVSDEFMKVGFVAVQSFVDEFESCIKNIIGEKAMQRFKTCDLPGYTDLMENVSVKLKSKWEVSRIKIYLPTSLKDIFDGNASPLTLQEVIDMSVYGGQISIRRDKMIWNLEDFFRLFNKPIKKLIRILQRVPSYDMEDIDTFIMFGRLAEYPLVQNAVKKFFSTKHLVVLSTEQVKSGAICIGNM